MLIFSNNTEANWNFDESTSVLKHTITMKLKKVQIHPYSSLRSPMGAPCFRFSFGLMMFMTT